MANINVNERYEFDASFRKFTLLYEIELSNGETFNSITVVSSSPTWCNVKNTTVTAYNTELELSSNTSITDGREATLTMTVKTSSGTYTKTVTIVQRKMEIYPIWANNTVRIETQTNSVDYCVKLNNEIIYAGKAYVMPSKEYIEIDISKICSSYLDSTMENSIDSPKDFNAQNGVRYFVLWVNDEQHSAYLYYNSYSYTRKELYTDIYGDNYMILSDPIRKEFDSRQYVVSSFFNATQVGSYRFDFYFHKGQFTHESISDTLVGRTSYTTMSRIPNEFDTVQIFGDNIPIKKTCARYCLYYQNALGGWDSFLINGNDKQTDKITSYKYIKAVDNTTSKFGTKKYMNVISPTYKLYTDWLNDDEASRMHHLLESTEVYMHDLENDKIIPVNISNTNCEYKTFSNNGKKKFYYVIDVESAQNKIRQ